MREEGKASSSVVGPWRWKVLWLLGFLLLGTEAAAAQDLVLTAPLRGTVGTALEQHLEEVLQECRDQDAALLVLEIDTPGGLVSAMREMVRMIQSAPCPVVAWVAPGGAQAASAGAFLVQAAHVAAMAEGTNLGAAHPVSSGGELEGEMDRKLTNDLTAQMRSLAQLRGRNADAAARMVTESASYPARDALEGGVVDLVAGDLAALISSVEGRIVAMPHKEVVISLEKYQVQALPMSLPLRILEVITRPDVAYLLLVAGIYAIVFEVLTPGGFIMGISGALLLLLGALGMRMLPFNWAGILLLGAGVGVMILDLVVGGMGFLSLFGAAALVVGGLVLFRAPGGELMRFSVEIMGGGVLGITLFFLLSVWAVWRALRHRAASGQEGLVGSLGTVLQDLNPRGMIRCHGEYWKARTESGLRVPDGATVEVVALEGLTLVVRPLGTIVSGNAKEEFPHGSAD